LVELRKLQGAHGTTSFVVTIPKEFADVLDLKKGDYMKIKVVNNTIVMEKFVF